ncbi:MAG: hypothetical protein RBS39_00145 [Phycisphaerales bacterium]|jgi:hypothetical protein|nr:hypothetical protein [Phycisphaerales bacterium]
MIPRLAARSPAASNRARSGRALFVLVLLCLAMLAAPARAQSSRPALRPLESPVVGVFGRTIVAPVELAGARPKRDPVIRLDDGRVLAARLSWIGVSPGASGPAPWLPSAGAWFTRDDGPPHDVVPGTAGFWALVLDAPLDAVGQGLWVDGVRWEVRWLPDPRGVRRGDEPVALGCPTPFALRASPVLRQHGLEESRSPFRRWRWLLLAGELDRDFELPTRLEDLELDAREGAFADPIVEAMARQEEALWRIGLARLALADEALAQRLTARLACVIDFGAGDALPAWTTDPRELASLRQELLREDLSPEQRGERVRLWLDAQAPAVAWVIDDAGAIDAMTGHPSATIGLAHLGMDPVLAWVSGLRGAEPELRDAQPGRVIELYTFTPPEQPVGDAETFAGLAKPPPAGETLTLTLGLGSAWTGRVSVRARALPAVPPGIVIGPLLADWTLSDWQRGTGDDARAASACAGSLYLEPSDPPRWMLYLEVADPGSSTSDGPWERTDAIRVWLGPRGAAWGVLRVSESGRVTFEDAQGNTSALEGAEVRQGASRWTARVPIPDGAIDADGVLRLGLERVDPLGVRSAWPRRMMPTQDEPARLAIDTRAWSAELEAGGVNAGTPR